MTEKQENAIPIDGTSAAELLELVQSMRDLNPINCLLNRTRILKLAADVPSNTFPIFADFTESLIRDFTSSAWKITAANIMTELATCVEKARKKLAADNLLHPATENKKKAQHSVSLAASGTTASLDWILVQEKAHTPALLRQAVDALVNRNNLGETVFHVLFETLYKIDQIQAVNWCTNYLERNRGQLDPDIVRDLLKCWQSVDYLPPQVLPWICEWAADDELRRQWPMIPRLADQILRRHALTVFNITIADSNLSLLRQLRRLIEKDISNEPALRSWMNLAISRIGTHITAFAGFISQSETEMEWTSKALYEELNAVNALLPAILLLADIVLTEPDGCTRLAMSLVGMPDAEVEKWHATNEKRIQHFITRTFLDDLRKGQPPEKSIRAFCLGDTELLRQMLSNLDILTRNFESLSQRNKITGCLAAHYASFTEQKMLPKELTNRYRLLMQALHEDNLRRCLRTNEAERVHTMPNLRELASAAADARRFLSRSRAMERPLKEVLAAQFDFEKNIRRRRLRLIRALLTANNTGSDKPQSERA